MSSSDCFVEECYNGNLRECTLDAITHAVQEQCKTNSKHVAFKELKDELRKGAVQKATERELKK